MSSLIFTLPFGVGLGWSFTAGSSLLTQKPECLLLFRTLVDRFGIAKIAFN